MERAKTESPFGTTIAHGNLTLSMIDGFRPELVESTGFKLGVNYGWNKIRFPAPVPAGSRIRASVEAVSVDDVGGGWHQIVQRGRRGRGLREAGLRGRVGGARPHLEGRAGPRPILEEGWPRPRPRPVRTA